jgi:sugar lactone lactonase YvrE
MWRAAVLTLFVLGLVAGPAAASTTVVADRLARPRGLAIAPDGTLYATLVGTGGMRCNFEGCFGASGSIVRVTPGGAVKIVADGLLSMRGQPDGFFSLGADQLTVLPDGRLMTAISAEFNEAPNTPPRQVPKAVRKQSGRLVFVTPGGRREIGPNVSAVEYRDDPDGEGKVSNPYGVAALGDALYVSDSAANALLEIRGSDVRAIAVFPHTEADAQSVPAALTAGTDGALYVGEYTGNESKGHSARIWRVVPGAAPVLFASGLTTISALATGPDGALYATEFRPGRVIKIAPDGTKTTVATGLHYPGGVAVGKDGKVYVSDWSVAGATREDAYRKHTGRILLLT